MKKQIDVATQTLTFTFDEGIKPISIKMADVTPANATYAMLHGFAARIGDNAAIPVKDPKTGAVVKVTEAMRAEAVQELVTYYTSGATDWNVKTRTPRAPVQNPTWLAIATKRGITYEAYVAERVAADLAELEQLG